MSTDHNITVTPIDARPTICYGAPGGIDVAFSYALDGTTYTLAAELAPLPGEELHAYGADATLRAIAADKDGRRFLYRPLIGREDYVDAESQGLLDRLFDGRLAPLVSHFSKREKLNPEDIAELRRLLDKIDDDQ